MHQKSSRILIDIGVEKIYIYKNLCKNKYDNKQPFLASLNGQEDNLMEKSFFWFISFWQYFKVKRARLFIILTGYGGLLDKILDK